MFDILFELVHLPKNTISDIATIESKGMKPV